MLHFYMSCKTKLLNFYKIGLTLIGLLLWISIGDKASAGDAFFTKNATISGTILGNAYLGFASIYDVLSGQNPSSPTVILANGGTIEGAVEAYNSSTFNANGGTIMDYIATYDSSRLNLRDGVIEEWVEAHNLSRVNMYGGSVLSYMFAHNNSIINIRDGSIFGHVGSFNKSQIAFYNGSINQSVSAYDKSSIAIHGGFVGDGSYAVSSYNESAVNVTGGKMYGDMSAKGGSTITIRGGHIRGSVSANDNGRVTVLGGTIKGSLSANNSSTLYVYGTGLVLRDPVQKASGVGCTLIGTLSDGTNVSGTHVFIGKNAKTNLPIRTRVLMVHGIWADDTTWGVLKPQLPIYHVDADTINFGTEEATKSNEAPIENQAVALAGKIATILKDDKDGWLDLVCHSMGGLAARWYLTHPALWPKGNLGPYPAGVRELIMIGTPNLGADSWLSNPPMSLIAAYSASKNTKNPSTDTVTAWSPALREMYAQWQSPPVYSNGKWGYPDGYALDTWPTSSTKTGFSSPITNSLWKLVDIYSNLPWLAPDVAKVIKASLELLPKEASTRFQNHVNYYNWQKTIESQLSDSDPALIEGVQARWVSNFLADLTKLADSSCAKIYIIAGTSNKIKFAGIDALPGPYSSKMPSDAIVPVNSVLGIDPITGKHLFNLAAEPLLVKASHTDLPSDQRVKDQVIKWLRQW